MGVMSERKNVWLPDAKKPSRNCWNCTKRMGYAMRSDAIYCSVQCRVTHWRRHAAKQTRIDAQQARTAEMRLKIEIGETK